MKFQHYCLLTTNRLIRCPRSKLAPESDLDLGLVSRPLVEAIALVEGRRVEVHSDGALRMARVLHAVEAKVI